MLVLIRGYVQYEESIFLLFSFSFRMEGFLHSSANHFVYFGTNLQNGGKVNKQNLIRS